jgi:hypothetical protein
MKPTMTLFANKVLKRSFASEEKKFEEFKQ